METTKSIPVDAYHGIDMALRTFGAAFAALCMWLTVRIVNRRERWAKWTLVAVIGLPILYVVSFGPVCWIVSRNSVSWIAVSTVYRPVIRVWLASPDSIREAGYSCLRFGRGHRHIQLHDGVLQVTFE